MDYESFITRTLKLVWQNFMNRYRLEKVCRVMFNFHVIREVCVERCESSGPCHKNAMAGTL